LVRRGLAQAAQSGVQTLLEGLLLGGSSKVKKIQELKIELSSIAVEARDNFKHLSTLVLPFPHH
jgi:hypothetical protein